MMMLYLFIAKLSVSDFSLTNRPVFYIALVAMIIGMQLFLSGFVAELISRNSADRNHYMVEDTIGIL